MDRTEQFQAILERYELAVRNLEAELSSHPVDRHKASSEYIAAKREVVEFVRRLV